MELPNAKILQTIVTPSDGGVLVQLQISDGSLDAEDGAIRLVLGVQVSSPPPQSYLVGLQYSAIHIVRSLLEKLEEPLQNEMNRMV